MLLVVMALLLVELLVVDDVVTFRSHGTNQLGVVIPMAHVFDFMPCGESKLMPASFRNEHVNFSSESLGWSNEK